VSPTPAWYRERPEPESVHAGHLRRETAGDGPMGRTGPRFDLEVASGERLRIYAPHLEAELEPWVDREVRLRGKLVDLRAEGLGVELWSLAVDGGDAG
jgi:hypothetical protein